MCVLTRQARAAPNRDTARSEKGFAGNRHGLTFPSRFEAHSRNVLCALSLLR